MIRDGGKEKSMCLRSKEVQSHRIIFKIKNGTLLKGANGTRSSGVIDERNGGNESYKASVCSEIVKSRRQTVSAVDGLKYTRCSGIRGHLNKGIVYFSPLHTRA